MCRVGEWCKVGHKGLGRFGVWEKQESLMWLKGRWEWSRTSMRSVGQQGESP